MVVRGSWRNFGEVSGAAGNYKDLWESLKRFPGNLGEVERTSK